jgi:hypothetical protein
MDDISFQRNHHQIQQELYEMLQIFEKCYNSKVKKKAI